MILTKYVCPEHIKLIIRYLMFFVPAALFGFGLVSDTWPVQRFFIYYLTPTVFVVFYWISLRLKVNSNLILILLAIDILILFLSFIRLLGFMPFSGHMLFLTYSFITTKNLFYRITAFVVILETTIFKLLIWHDLQSWMYGIILGTAFGTFYYINSKLSVKIKINVAVN